TTSPVSPTRGRTATRSAGPCPSTRSATGAARPRRPRSCGGFRAPQGRADRARARSPPSPAPRGGTAGPAAGQLEVDGSATTPYGIAECRHGSARDSDSDLLWIYALANPHPDRLIEAVVLTPRDEPSVVYAITLTELAEHPLRPGVRRKARLAL